MGRIDRGTMPLGRAFKITSDNPVGRQQIEHGYVTHNKFICNAAPYTECHQTLSSVNHRELKRLKPSWMPSPYECFHAKTMEKMMKKMRVSAAAVVDSGAPELAWNHRRLNNKYRKFKVNDPVYKETQATEVQWSDQEASFARDAFKQMNKSIHRSKCVVDTHISEGSLRYIEIKRQDLEKKLPVINEPMHPHGSPLQHLNKPKPAVPQYAPEGTPLARSEFSWTKPTGANREVAIGVPDALGDHLRVVAPPSTKKTVAKPLPEKLQQQTVHNGWDKATNGHVRTQYLQHAGHNTEGNELSGTKADLRGLVQRNGGEMGGKPSTVHSGGSSGPLRRTNSYRTKAGDSRVSTPVYSETTCMYAAKVKAARLTKPGSGELTVRQGEKVFVLEDGRERYFKVVNQEGQLGEVPCHIVAFTESVPAGRLQPAANGLGPSPAATQIIRSASAPPCAAVLSDTLNEDLGLYQLARDIATPNSVHSRDIATPSVLDER